MDRGIGFVIRLRAKSRRRRHNLPPWDSLSNIHNESVQLIDPKFSFKCGNKNTTISETSLDAPKRRVRRRAEKILFALQLRDFDLESLNGGGYVPLLFERFLGVTKHRFHLRQVTFGNRLLNSRSICYEHNVALQSIYTISGLTSCLLAHKKTLLHA